MTILIAYLLGVSPTGAHVNAASVLPPSISCEGGPFFRGNPDVNKTRTLSCHENVSQKSENVHVGKGWAHVHLVWTQLEKKERGEREKEKKKGKEERKEKKGKEASSLGLNSVKSYGCEKCADLGGQVLAKQSGMLDGSKIKFNTQTFFFTSHLMVL